ncbi:MAG TPA: hypothetical protein VI796_00730 [Candidatus Thermoplasmatota archaeon]|nr:hypothetical protein [Candidatus Thermoplasmatota archaeon]
MGVKLGDLFPQHPVPPGWYDGKRIAVDGHNVAFRYLTSFRGKDGDVLRNPDGRAIGHLIGFVNLVRSLRREGAEPIVVWDGTVHPKKRATVEGRIQKRLEAALNAQEAEAAGDREAHHRYLRMTTYLDAAMIQDATRILEPLGVAVVRADHDGERYAAALCRGGHADAVATEDYDALVAGAPAVLRKAGSAEPFLHDLKDLATHNLSQAQLRQVAILCGTDWNDGVDGFGAKTALKALVRFPDLRVLVKEAQAGSEETRWHKMVKDAGLTLAEFVELEAFIEGLPDAGAPKRHRPDPERASAVGVELGIDKSRIMSCFC